MSHRPGSRQPCCLSVGQRMGRGDGRQGGRARPRAWLIMAEQPSRPARDQPRAQPKAEGRVSASPAAKQGSTRGVTAHPAGTVSDHYDPGTGAMSGALVVIITVRHSAPLPPPAPCPPRRNCTAAAPAPTASQPAQPSPARPARRAQLPAGLSGQQGSAASSRTPPPSATSAPAWGAAEEQAAGSGGRRPASASRAARARVGVAGAEPAPPAASSRPGTLLAAPSNAPSLLPHEHHTHPAPYGTPHTRGDVAQACCDALAAARRRRCPAWPPTAGTGPPTGRCRCLARRCLARRCLAPRPRRGAQRGWASSPSKLSRSAEAAV
jgi:hypothetical protein